MAQELIFGYFMIPPPDTNGILDVYYYKHIDKGNR